MRLFLGQLHFISNIGILILGGVALSERELAKQIIDKLPEYKISSLLLFLRGIQFDDDIEDDLYCEKLVEEYLNNPDPEKHQTVTLEDLAAREEVVL